VIDVLDDCPSTPDPAQLDTDGDGAGDACDTCTDPDRDGFGDLPGPFVTCPLDNCPGLANPGQADADADGVGDACDPCNDVDHDGRGVSAGAPQSCGLDNCPLAPNPGQENADGDGLGDACDTCPLDAANDGDHDGLCADRDVCPMIPNPAQEDADGDRVGDACDNCPVAPNPAQADSDGDRIGNACDLCPAFADPSQPDADGDRAGDACDNCPTAANPDQADSNHDGAGDACQPFIVIDGVVQDGGDRLEVRARARDPQGEPITGSLQLFAGGGDDVAIEDAFVNFDCGTAWLPDGQPGRGIGFAYGAVNEPVLFDMDSFFLCQDGAPDFMIAAGTCAAPTGAFDLVLALQTFTTPFPLCIRRMSEATGGIDLTVTDYDMSTLHAHVGGETLVRTLPFSGALPRQIPIADLTRGRPHRLRIEATDGHTPAVRDDAAFTPSGETTLLLNTPPIAGAVWPSAAQECAGAAGATLVLDASASRDPDSPEGGAQEIVSYEWFDHAGTPDERRLGTGPLLTVSLPVGGHDLSLRVTDAWQETGGAATHVTIGDSVPPTVQCPEAVVAECTGPQGATVSIAAASSDLCNPLPTVANDRNGGGADAGGVYPLGRTTVRFTADDGHGHTSSCTTDVTVQDTVAPSLTFAADASFLYPPNHGMVPVRLSYAAADLCSPSPAVRLTAVESSEPDDGPGTGDGATLGDIAGVELGTADTGILLRAERAGAGSGRIYTLRASAADAAGNVTPALAVVAVPHDLGYGPEPLIVQVEPAAADGRVRLVWAAVPEAATYDVISGDLAALRAVAGSVQLGTVRVLARGLPGTVVTESSGTAAPPRGSGVFYLVQSRSVRGPSGYGTESVPWPRIPAACEGGCP